MEPLKIFLSSTSVDLMHYREVLVKVLLRMHHLPLVQNYMGSYITDPVTISLEYVRDCDLFIGLYAFRYGHTPEPNGFSITEQEFIKAKELGKPRLCYFMKEQQRPAIAAEEEWKQKALAEFKQYISRELVRDEFGTPEELSASVAADIAKYLTGDVLGYSFEDTEARWRTSEAETRARLIREKLEQHYVSVESPLMDFWTPFITDSGWHEKLKRSCETVSDYASQYSALGSLAQRFNSLDYHLSYDTILEQLKRFDFDEFMKDVGRVIDNIEKESRRKAKQQKPPESGFESESEPMRLTNAQRLRQKLIDIRKERDDPRYQRCFLVSGSLGAGKTNFLLSLLKNADAADNKNNDPDGASPPAEGRNFLVLLLEPPYSDESLEETILRGIEIATMGMRWRSLEDFNRLLEGYNQTLNARPLTPKMRLVIAIDDVQEWLLRGKSGERTLEALTRRISSYTKLHNVYWALTLHDTDYPEVSGSSWFWQTYSHFFRDAYLSSTAELSQPRRGNFDHSRIAASGLNIGGWLVLDELNRESMLGRRLLEKLLNQHEVNEALALVPPSEKESVERQLASPFIAWLLFELHDDLPLNQIVHLNYIEFVERFWTKRRTALRGALEDELKDDLSDASNAYTLLEQGIAVLAKALLHEPDPFPLVSPVVDSMTEIARQDTRIDYKLRERKTAERLLIALEKGNLLKRFEEHQKSFPVERIRVRFAPFWGFHLAAELQENDAIRTRHSPEAKAALEDWYRARRSESAVEAESLKEAALEFLFLFLDLEESAKNQSRTFINDLARHGLNSKELPATAVWFAAPKAGKELQRSLAALSFNLKRDFTQRDLFALMYFVSQAAPDALDAPTRLQLLSQHYRIIQPSLTLYFYYIVEQLFKRIDDKDELLACLPHFVGCEVLNITPELAWLTVDTLNRIVNQNSASMLDVILRYLKNNGAQAEAQYEALGKARWRRHFYREWVLFDSCHHIVDVERNRAFEFFERTGWYHLPKINHHIQREMEREANIALGGGYRRSWVYWEKEEFYEVLKRLVSSSDFRDRQLAFHIIRHTEPTDGHSNIRVDPAFHSMLETIFLDPRLSKTVEQFGALFEKNFTSKQMAALLRRRQSRVRKR